MKILKEGTLPDTEYEYRKYKGECYKCACQVQCNHCEALIKQRTSPYSYTVTWKYILCPTVGCGKDIILC